MNHKFRVDIFATQRRKIRELLVKENRSEAWLADRVGESRQNVNNWLSTEEPKNPRNSKVFQDMLAALGAGDVGDPTIPVGFPQPMIRFAGNVPAGDWGDPLESEEFIEVSDLRLVHPRRFAAYVIGDSCYPFLQPGDLTFWHANLNPPYQRLVLAQRKGDHGCTVKELNYDEARGRNILTPLNKAHSEPDDGEGWGVIAMLVGVIFEGLDMEIPLYQPKGLTRKHLQIRQKLFDIS